MNLEITGKLIEKYDTQQVKDTFKKREFVLELAEEINGSPYTTFAKMQLVQAKCDILDRFQIGDNLRVNFNIKGNRYERDGKVNYFSNLDAWRIEKADAAGNNSNSSGYNNPGYNNNNGGNNGGGFQNNSNGNSGNWGGNNNNNNGGFQNNNNSGNANAYQPAGGNGGADADDLPF